MRRKTPQRPPKRLCRDCGTDVYSWAEGVLCPLCAAAVRANHGRPGWTRDMRPPPRLVP